MKNKNSLSRRNFLTKSALSAGAVGLGLVQVQGAELKSTEKGSDGDQSPINIAEEKPKTNSDGKVIAPSPLIYINTLFDNGSPLFWNIESDGKITIELLYDYERNTINRANSHWHFQLLAKPGSDLTLVLKNFYNIWNGYLDLTDATEETICFVSEDGLNWKSIQTKLLDGQKLEVKVHMNSESLFVSRLEPYGLSDLELLKAEIAKHSLVKITEIGKTFEGRPLEIIRIGHSDAPYRVFIRSRAHAWEVGGNWVVQGLIRSLISDSFKSNRYLDRYAVYIMPMANKDRVVRGGTRFTVGGVNLNRNWDKAADPKYNPENAALETWLEQMIKHGLRPDLAIDIHNDGQGNLHFSHPSVNLEKYMNNMNRFEKILRKHTWYTEGAKKSSFKNSGTFGEGLVERYGIDAFIYELNANWIEGLSKVPYGEDWELLGKQLKEVFYDYFKNE